MRQIAEALAKAHETGIIHRDLKPKIDGVRRTGGRFSISGWAKFFELENEDLSGSCTTAALETQADMVVGTVEYMSPEQASGRPLDFRSDQFSFGLVLYEMASGKHAFHKRTQAQT